MKTKILLVRHGQTDWNTKNLIQGDSDFSRLTEEGRRQTRLVKERLIREKIRIDAVYSSPLERAIETANMLKPDGMEIRIMDSLRERHFPASLEGKTFDENIRKRKKLFETWKRIRELPGVKDVETVREVKIRSYKAHMKIAKENMGKTVLVVSHGGFIKNLVLAVKRKPASYLNEFDIDNCSITVLEYDEKKLRVVKINDTRHLTAR
ncbi:MAG: histidine phosphatase family protein [Candidatus Aenigmarchaeota archaeon]|nr:histidine phosphatase family protein [Candidatus Aenigmarchaeota archaeon]